ncbi:MAG TPA: murein biosynthesis integral membrane protein MurJ [Opitutaceae bacterium]|nr:murein biosynthesis integral membrane protein MurJ [Opitutaceae bacterium]
MSKKLQNIGIVSLLTIVSRVLGLARDAFGAAVFGLGGLQDAFVTAFSLPNLFRRLLGEGALTAAFVPKLQEEMHARARPGAFALLSNVATWLTVVTAALVGLAMLLLSQARRFQFEDKDYYLLADLSILLFPYVAFVCVAAALSAALNVLGRFTEPALNPIWLNLAMIVSLAVAVRQLELSNLQRMHWLCAGVLVGGLLQVMVPAFALVREGWRPRFDLARSAAVREIAALMAPALFGVAIYQINIYVSRLIAFSLERSAASALYFANRLMELPIGVFAIAVATVVYPLIAKHAVERRFAEMAVDYRKGLRLILVINVPAAAGLALLSEPIVRLLFQRGEFTADKTHIMAPLLALFAIGMPFFSVTSLSTRAFYAVKDTTTPVKAATVSFVVNLLLTLALKNVLGARGLVMASTVAVLVQTWLLQHWLAQKLPGMEFGQLWRSLGKILLGTGVMSAAVWGGWRLILIGWPGSRTADAIAIFGLIPIAVGIYAAVLWVLRIEGREELATLAAKVRARFA